MSIFKAYDIRGLYPTELDESKAEAIGWATAKFIQAQHTSQRLPHSCHYEDPDVTSGDEVISSSRHQSEIASPDTSCRDRNDVIARTPTNVGDEAISYPTLFLNLPAQGRRMQLESVFILFQPFQ